ncbi:hypothetical protein [Serratia liquefaciens]|uniref:hypothetical protein n=1 Tax=Serratia liquefaciens TaxID=614 RepID=UPI00301D1B63
MRKNPYKEQLKLARSQRKRLQTMFNRFAAMATEWEGLDGGMECDFNLLAEKLEPQLEVMDTWIDEWRKGTTDDEGEMGIHEHY